MMKLRCGARLAQEPGPGGRISRHLSINHFERDDGAQDGVPSAIGYCHRPRSQLDGKTVHADLDLKVGVT
jgi:hypothetical protein